MCDVVNELNGEKIMEIYDILLNKDVEYFQNYINDAKNKQYLEQEGILIESWRIIWRRAFLRLVDNLFSLETWLDIVGYYK